GLVRLDREADATAVAVDRGDLRVHPFADREPLRTLLAAVARQLGATDEARDVAGQRQLDAVLVHRRDGAGHHLTPANALERGLERIVLELLDAEADTLLLHVHVQHLHPDSVAAAVVLDRLLARPLPVEVGEVDHAVDVARQADEQAELGDVLDLALELRADRVALHEALPRVAHGLLDAEADATLVRIDVEHLDFDLLTGRYDLARVHVLLGPAHLGDVDQTLDARLQLHEGAVIGDVGNTTGEACADRVLELHAFPRIGLQLLHAEGDALRLRVEADDLHLDGLADLQRLARMVDAPPRDVGDVEQPVDAAEIDERAVIGDVLDDALEDLTFLQAGDQLAASLGAGFLEHRAARDDDVAAAAIHLEDQERLRGAHQRADVADGADIDLATRQERYRTGEVDGETALHAAEDDAGHLLAGLERLLELGPCLLAARLLPAQHRLAVPVFQPLDIDVDRVADLQIRLLTRRRELLQRDPPLGLQPHVDQGHVVVDVDDRPLDDRAFEAFRVLKGLLQHGREVFHRPGLGRGL